MIDSALLRPGRFDRLLYVGLPDYEARIEIFKIYTKNDINQLTELDYIELANLTDGYTGAEIASICRESSLIALEKDFNNIKLDINNYKTAIDKIKPQVTKELIRYYENIQGRSMI